MATQANATVVGTPAPDFTLPSVDGIDEVSLSDFADAPALLVAFICSHCPYVQHIEDELGKFAAEYSAKGLATVGITSNDVATHPNDSPQHADDQALRAGFTFPYLYDETQEVAHAFGAACTPDLFLFDAQRNLAYRGQFDSSRHKEGTVATGATLRRAADHVLAGEPVPFPHPNAIGCNIKWKPDNEPGPTFSLL